jgi:hypothetical protein
MFSFYHSHGIIPFLFIIQSGLPLDRDSTHARAAIRFTHSGPSCLTCDAVLITHEIIVPQAINCASSLAGITKYFLIAPQ